MCEACGCPWADEGMGEPFVGSLPGCQERVLLQDMPAPQCHCKSALSNPSLGDVCPSPVDFVQQREEFRSQRGGLGLHLTR